MSDRATFGSSPILRGNNNDPIGVDKRGTPKSENDKKPSFTMEKWLQQKPSDGPWPEAVLQKELVGQSRQQQQDSSK
ncbi:MAG: hypothetical protein M1820_010471 [Bogoriella megaspora]|nr:MAG: hypothetical protein M1820_010471 [Bogoriella megaspora]